ncbi:hypothetical protein ACTXT7_008180, partial [Hymenolepis weldensis]
SKQMQMQMQMQMPKWRLFKPLSVKPPCIDSVASGGRPYVSQQDSAPSHKALKTQD